MIEITTPNSEQLSEAKSWPVWEKEPSSFDWDYEQKEVFYILEGEAQVTMPKGQVHHLKGNDLVTIEKCGTVQWQITKLIRKHYVFY